MMVLVVVVVVITETLEFLMSSHYPGQCKWNIPDQWFTDFPKT
jgi:hypothetical protein